ncbi:hypothetical protein AEB_P0593 [Altererythrobacter sp. B11]|nr:hypothetical protein AEB_P0593 [Altererythrobacter sp. B11]
MYPLRLEGHHPLRIEIGVEIAATGNAIEEFDAADLNHAIPGPWIKARGFGVEDDFPHQGIIGRDRSAGKGAALSG